MHDSRIISMAIATTVVQPGIVKNLIRLTKLFLPALQLTSWHTDEKNIDILSIVMSIFLLFSFLAYSSANHHVNWFVCSLVFINLNWKLVWMSVLLMKQLYRQSIHSKLSICCQWIVIFVGHEMNLDFILKVVNNEKGEAVGEVLTSNGNDIETKRNKASIIRHFLYRSESNKLIPKLWKIEAKRT
jgi:hypothetical protein